MPSDARYRVPALEGALSILETLGAGQPQGVSELAKQLGLSKGSAYRLLATLARRGYVEKCADSDRYQLTYRLFAVGSGAAERLGLREVAQPIMERLAARTGETVNLGVLDGFRTVSLHLVESAHPLRIHMRIGGVCAHATSTGKILLAALEPEELERRMASQRLAQYTSRTIRTRSGLLAELARVREQGHAVDDEECSLGLRCVGAPIRDHRGGAVAALSMVAPCHRLGPEKLPGAVTMVREAAGEVSKRLGFTGNAPRAADLSAAGGPPAGGTGAGRRGRATLGGGRQRQPRRGRKEVAG